MIFEHVAATGRGHCRVDRWPDPQVVLAEVTGNIALRGDPAHAAAAGLDDLAGFVDAPPDWLTALRELDPATAVWDRVIATLPADVDVPPSGADIRPLRPADDDALAGLTPDIAWIHQTWGGAAGLAAAGVGRGAFVDGALVSVAVPFYLGAVHEDIGVVTEAGCRGRGLSAACAGTVVADIRGRGRTPSWTTSRDNTASLAVAARLGFAHVRDDVLYAVRTPIPRS